jgi:hypothetical protein
MKEIRRRTRVVFCTLSHSIQQHLCETGRCVIACGKDSGHYPGLVEIAQHRLVPWF